MEFLDSLDFQTKKKTNRVRSWYLYEQFKSLESSQLEATKKLKNRYYQDKILRRELSERKARRSLYDQSRSCTDDCSVRSTDTKTSLYTSTDNIFVGYQLENEQIDQDERSELEIADHEAKQDESDTERPSSAFESVADLDDSIASAVEVLKNSENITDEIKEELEFVKHGIAENITLQLETAKQNVQCLEQFSDFCDYERISEKESRTNFDDDDVKSVVPKKQRETNNLYDNNLVAAWMKIVSFAYQVIKLNHGGNCYCDYSSQVLTAVLACDVLRRGVTRMCDMLQPYTCPIKFANDETILSCYKNVKRKTDMQTSYKHRLPYLKPDIETKQCKCQRYRKYKSENLSKYRVQNNKCRSKITSEPGRNISNRGYSNKTSTIWPSELGSEQARQCYCHYCIGSRRNPMTELSKYVDDILFNI